MKHMSLNYENNRIYAKNERRRRRDERIIRLMEWSLIAVLVAYAVLVLAVAANVILKK